MATDHEMKELLKELNSNLKISTSALNKLTDQLSSMGVNKTCANSALAPVTTSANSALAPVTTTANSALAPVTTTANAALAPVSTSANSTLASVTTSANSALAPVTTSANSALTPVPTSANSALAPVTPSANSALAPVTTSANSALPPVTNSANSALAPVTTSAHAKEAQPRKWGYVNWSSTHDILKTKHWIKMSIITDYCGKIERGQRPSSIMRTISSNMEHYVDAEYRFPDDEDLFVDVNNPLVRAEMLNITESAKVKDYDEDPVAVPGLVKSFLNVAKNDMHTVSSFEEKYELKWVDRPTGRPNNYPMHLHKTYKNK